MNILDIIILFIILFSGILAIYKGFVGSAIGFIGMIAILYILSNYGNYFEPYLENYSLKQIVKVMLSKVAVFVICIFILSIIQMIAARFVFILKMFIADKLLGLLFGLFRGYLIVSIIIYCINLTQFQNNEIIKGSIFIPFFSKGVSYVDYYFDDIKQLLEDSKK